MEKKTKTVEKEVVSIAKRQFEGEVISVSGNKTVSVRVDRMKIHAKYNKQYKQSTKFAVHDEKNIAKVGDTARIEECRPLSKSKRWFLVSIVK